MLLWVLYASAQLHSNQNKNKLFSSTIWWKLDLGLCGIWKWFLQRLDCVWQKHVSATRPIRLTPKHPRQHKVLALQLPVNLMLNLRSWVESMLTLLHYNTPFLKSKFIDERKCPTDSYNWRMKRNCSLNNYFWISLCILNVRWMNCHFKS